MDTPDPVEGLAIGDIEDYYESVGILHHSILHEELFSSQAVVQLDLSVNPSAVAYKFGTKLNRSRRLVGLTVAFIIEVAVEDLALADT